MQLHLSKLVDLALGDPENMKSDNFNILHTLFHIMLKKLNLADLCVGLDNNSAKMVSNLINNLHQDEPSISFKEVIYKFKKTLSFNNFFIFQFHIRSDGSKIKKKNFNSIGHKNSLIHVQKKNYLSLESNSNIQKDLQNRSENSYESKVSASMAIEHEKIKKQQTDFETIFNKESTEILLLKKQISELSDSLKLHSNCLKKVKCEDLPKVNLIQNQFSDVLRNHESQQINVTNEMTNSFKIIQKQISSINEHLKGLASNFDIYKNSLKDEVSSQIDSHFQNSIKLIQRKTDDFEKFVRTLNFIPSYANNKNQDLNSILTTIDEIQKQVTSQSICMHQYVRDLGSKLDRCEFNIYCRQMNDMIDIVVQLKKDIQSYTGAMNCMTTNVNMITANTSHRPQKNAGNKKLKQIISPRCLTPLFKNRYRAYYHNL